MVIFWIFAVIALVGLAGYAGQVAAVIKTVRAGAEGTATGTPTDQVPGDAFCPPISILKPLKGLDDNLFDNLESFCLQDYPAYEIIFSIQDHDDPSCRIVRKIKDKYPDREITVLIERCDEGLNPKVNNLIPAVRAARYGHVLISDSNVLVGRDYLRAVAGPMSDDRVGLVSSLIRGVRGRTLGSVFENLHLNSFIAGSVCLLDRFLHMPCVIGKSMLMRKADLEAIGGMHAVKDFLAEDYIIGKRMHDSGRRVVLSNYAVNNVNEYWGLKKFINRHTRWGKLRWRIGGPKYLAELAGNAVFMSFLPLLLSGFSAVTASLAIGVSAIKMGGDYYLGRRLRTGMNPLLYLFVPVKDIVIGCIWFVPLLSSSVVWRGNRYVIGDSSLLAPYPESGLWTLPNRIFNALRTKAA